MIYQVSAVDGSVGGSVLLPCIFTDSPSTKVFWRDKDDNVVLNIENGSPVYSSQNVRYRDRVTSIQEEIGKGNFSILMKNLQVNDSDTYVCTILPGVNERRVQLTVTGEFKFMFLHNLERPEDEKNFECSSTHSSRTSLNCLCVSEKVSPTSAGKTAGSSRGAAGPSIHQVVLLAAVGVLLSC